MVDTLKNIDQSLLVQNFKIRRVFAYLAILLFDNFYSQVWLVDNK